MGKRWTKEELEFVEIMKQNGESVRKTARILGRTILAVINRWKQFPPHRKSKKLVNQHLLRQVRHLRRRGFSRLAIAKKLGCHDRTIGRWMQRYHIP